MTTPKRDKRRKWPWAIGVALVVIIAMAAVFISNDGRLPFIDNNRDIGQGVEVPKDALPSDLKAETTDAPSPFPDRFGDAWLHTITPVLRFSPSGQLPGAVTFTVPLSRPLADNEIPIMMINHSAPADLTPWEPQPVQLSSDRAHIVVSLDHLSDGQVAAADTLSPGKIFNDLVQETFAGLLSKGEKPTCGNGSKFEENGYVAAADPGDALTWCYGYENGGRVIKATNMRRYPVEVYKAKDIGLSDGDIPFSFVEMYGLSHTVIMPLSSATFFVNSIDPGATAYVQTHGSSSAMNLMIIDALAKAFIMLVGSLLSKAAEGSIAALKAGRLTRLDDFGLAGIRLKDALETLKDGYECRQVIDGGEVNLAKLVSSCFSNENLRNVFKVGLSFQTVLILGAIAAAAGVLATVFAVIALPQSIANLIGDAANGRDRFTITVNRKKADFASFAGFYQRHYGTLQVNKDGTAALTESFNCPDGDVQHYCQSVYDLQLAGDSDKSLSATVSKVTRLKDNAPVGSFPNADDLPEIKKDDTMTLRRDAGDLVTVIYKGRLAPLNAVTNSTSGGETFCGESTPYDKASDCGA